jgi:hypothetical protein
MTNEDRDELNAILAAHEERVLEELTEQSARLSTMRFLLEDLYADAYTHRLVAFDARMTELIDLTRNATTRGNPMTDDQAIEMQARIATHLQRFHEAVVPRIQRRSKQ